MKTSIRTLAGSLAVALATVCYVPSSVAESEDERLFRGWLEFRARELAVRAQVLEPCEKSTKSYEDVSPEMDVDKGAAIKRTYSAHKWSGACTNGKRDGRGNFVMKEDEMLIGRDWFDETKQQRKVSKSTARWEGEFIDGKQWGIWCRSDFQHSFVIDGGKPTSYVDKKAEPVQCFLYEPTDQLPSVQPYARNADGSWEKLPVSGVRAGAPETLPTGTLERRSDEIIAAVRAGQSVQRAMLATQSNVLADLIPGAALTLAIGPPVDLHEKRVAVVFSSRALTELERFKRERTQLIEATASATGATARERQAFIAASDPQRFMQAMAQAIRPHVGALQLKNDLSGLQDGSVDYAVVLDWKFLARLDLAGKYDEFAAPFKDEWTERDKAFLGVEVTGYLIDRDLRAVVKLAQQPFWNTYRLNYDEFRWDLPERERKLARRGDRAYLHRLASYFEQAWAMTDPVTSVFNEVNFNLAGKPWSAP